MVCPLCITTAIVTYSPVLLSTSMAGYLAVRHSNHVKNSRLKTIQTGKPGTYARNEIVFNDPKLITTK